MPKLYFHYGAMGSAKTMNMLAVADAYTRQGKKVLILKPGTDIRDGILTVRSRIGIERKADYVITSPDDLKIDLTGISCLLIDEAQFLTPVCIDALRALTATVPVMCYGLRTDSMSKLFPGSQRLFELADTIHEIKITCSKCESKAVFNLRHHDGKKVVDGPQILLGTEDLYAPVCFKHYEKFET